MARTLSLVMVSAPTPLFRWLSRVLTLGCMVRSLTLLFQIFGDLHETFYPGRTECTYEPAMTKAFLHGRTEAIRSVQPYSVEFIKVGTATDECFLFYSHYSTTDVLLGLPTSTENPSSSQSLRWSLQTEQGVRPGSRSR